MFYLSCNTSNQVYTVCLCGDSHSLDQIYICLHLYINFLHLHAISKDPFNTEITWRGPLLWLCFLHSTCGSFQAWPCGIVWVVGIPPPVFAGKTQGEYLAVCLSPPSAALVDRRTHTSRPLWSDFPTWTHTCTQAHTHTRRAPSIHPRLSLPGCLHPATQLEMTHTRARTHTHTHSHGHARAPYAHSRVIHASFQITVLIKRSQKTERKLNKPRRPNEAVGHSFRSNPRDQPPVLFFEYNSGVS